MPGSSQLWSHICPHRVISLVGGGGKTTLMYRLARELGARGNRVITTTTTKISPPTPRDSPAVVLAQEAGNRLEKALDKALQTHGRITLAERVLPPGDKLQGIDSELMGWVMDRFIRPQQGVYGIIEADGAARKPFKAPAAHEPVVPEQTELLMAVVGLDVVGKPLHPAWVHRLKEISRITGLSHGDIIQPAHVAAVIAHPNGLMKHLPPDGASGVFLNKADEPAAWDHGRQIVRILKQRGTPHPQQAFIGAAAQQDWVREAFPLVATLPGKSKEAMT